MKLNKLFVAASLLMTASQFSSAAALKLEIYNPGNNSIFPVSSEIISGENEVVLIDAQFQNNDAEALVNKIKQLNKKLTTIYISHSDPDYYFGLETLTKAFPDAKVIASPATVNAIKANKDGKLAYWSGILKEQAPASLIVPEALEGNSFSIEGKPIIIQGINGEDPARTFVWIPDLKAVVGGVIVSDNIHVWIADTQTSASRQYWKNTLASIKQLDPKIIVPGHFTGKSALDIASVNFTLQYLNDFEDTAANSRNAAETIQKMTHKYPQLEDVSSLELSAKVIKGEMTWPQ
ncbi:MBL fold metallo-hydrolase [Moellerella wisconsensis]|uniref:MBL fold metallo-hydrolase n=2 Tax=Moellerella wisconsensis TaxID=158849 RepID=A0A9Q8V591_9GAMM|nr:MBL fold metallo-hydrolase [Moellerella wisconsensis]UNH24795.1 MBL fold metallo-hydrolase [Moellerella wisconsensis]UNH27910.1 MBL fold metallo-hydrolase [Moellerella wisconsensis]UNH31416.1 MBL fold metallo-hydrolase [Moellerella wisconsensis]UNH39522.1 MBL fold metallo-hydrolase [Moellerella wisconsensis]UNH43028.1 MBL fold metallo-hydrolase [Moellerella wisconsensis]